LEQLAKPQTRMAEGKALANLENHDEVETGMAAGKY